MIDKWTAVLSCILSFVSGGIVAASLYELNKMKK
jgi:hypothetical protein